MDISTVEGGEGLVNQAIKEFGQLDILVNVAGILRDRMIFNMTRAGVGRRHPRASEGALLHDAPGVGAHARAQIRPHHQFFLELGARQSRPAQLCCREGGDSRTDLQRGEFAREVWHHGECDHARRLDPHDRYDSGRPHARRDRHSAERNVRKERRAIPRTSRRWCVSSPATSGQRQRPMLRRVGLSHHALYAHRAGSHRGEGRDRGRWRSSPKSSSASSASICSRRECSISRARPWSIGMADLG